VMVDVARMPDNSFGTVPTPAIVAPIEFTMAHADYLALGGYAEHVRRLDDVLAAQQTKAITMPAVNPWPIGQAPVLG
jgi:6-hydroxynicotinate reductase